MNIDHADRVIIDGQAIVGCVKIWVDDARALPLNVALDRLGGEMDAVHDLLAEKLRKVHGA